MQMCDTLGPALALHLARHATPAAALEAFGEPLPREGKTETSSTRGADDLTRMTEALRRWRRRLGENDVERIRDLAAHLGVRVLVPGDPGWPRALDDLGPWRPHCLWAHGRADAAQLLGAGSVSIVGSRACTPYGQDVATDMAADLARSGLTVVSGGAFGIDAAAHRGALAVDGATIAVLAGGLDKLFPAGNRLLLEQIRSTHLLLAESPPEAKPTRWRFLSRNRMIAALTPATVVVEAAFRSGALSTARHALEMGREVGVVPGPVTSAASAGCHQFLRDTPATLVTDATEARELVTGIVAGSPGRGVVQDELDLLEPGDRHVLDGIPPRSSTTVQHLASELGWQLRDVQAALGRIELLGLLRRDGERLRRAA
jgi:DNA processing protein